MGILVFVFFEVIAFAVTAQDRWIGHEYWPSEPGSWIWGARDRSLWSEDRDLNWEPLDIAIIAPQNTLNQMPQNAIEGLRSAVQRMKLLVMVRLFEGHNFISPGSISKCTPLWRTTSDLYLIRYAFDKKLHRISVGKGIQLTSRDANFYAFLQVDYKSCEQKRSLMAAAAPCEVDDEKRPLSSKLHVCVHNKRWSQFASSADLFTHEFMHALGFGLINPDKYQSAVKPRPFIWKYHGGEQRVTSQYMDFQQTALEHARKHLGCSELHGVEAEELERIHLSEYIYGDELMTPYLSGQRNFFTRISASILEATKRGKSDWYRTNATMVDADTKEYWYGRGWGCTFAQKSCFEYIAEHEDLKETNSFPFCNSNDLRRLVSVPYYQTLGPELHVCFSNGSHTKTFGLHCNTQPLVRTRSSPIGLKARTLQKQLAFVPGEFRSLYGSDRPHRFCPFVEEILTDDIVGIPSNAQVVKCS